MKSQREASSVYPRVRKEPVNSRRSVVLGLFGIDSQAVFLTDQTPSHPSG